MKKYYGYFVYNDEEYVIRFKIKGSLIFDEDNRYFIDDKYYIRSTMDVLSLAAFGSHWSNIKGLSYVCFMITKSDFIEYRSKGVKRWKPDREIIDWP